MIRVRMRQHKEIQGTIPERQHTAEFRQNPVVRPAVYEDLPAAGYFHENRVALSRVKKRHAQILARRGVKNRVPDDGNADGERPQKNYGCLLDEFFHILQKPMPYPASSGHTTHPATATDAKGIPAKNAMTRI